MVGTKKKRGSGKSIESCWTEECEQGFQTLKQRLVSAPVLAYADLSVPFLLEIDASHSGLGAVLGQEKDGKMKPVAYASRGLRPTEQNMQNYSSMKLELLALKWAMTEKFRDDLLGQKCIVYTDNNPLSYLKTAKLGALEQRWASQLAAFDFEIRYRPGRVNGNADALSRQYTVIPSPQQECGTALPAILVELLNKDRPVEAVQSTIAAFSKTSKIDLRRAQEQDLVIGPALDFFSSKVYPTKEQRQSMSKRYWELLHQRLMSGSNVRSVVSVLLQNQISHQPVLQWVICWHRDQIRSWRLILPFWSRLVMEESMSLLLRMSSRNTLRLCPHGTRKQLR